MSLDFALFPHVGDVITALTNEQQWEAVGDDVADVVAACKESVESWYSDMLIGQVAQFVSAAPAGWLEFDGSVHAEDDYPELFGKVPSSWKDGTDFTLPDMQDVFLAGVGAAGTVGEMAGSNEHTLVESEMPSHTHFYTLPVLVPDTIGAGIPTPSVTLVTPGTPTSSAGSGNPHENKPEFLALVVAVYAGRV